MGLILPVAVEEVEKRERTKPNRVKQKLNLIQSKLVLVISDLEAQKLH